MIARSALLGTVLVPVAVWGAMLVYDRFDPMCGTGGEGGIACATRAFVVTVMSILPGLLIGVVCRVTLASRRDGTQGRAYNQVLNGSTLTVIYLTVRRGGGAHDGRLSFAIGEAP